MQNTDSIIFHITSQQEWENQAENPDFEALSLQSEGFIHSCSEKQKEGVLERYFAGQTNLLLLTIEMALINSVLKYEKATNGEFFPHIYGKINKNAILKIEQIA